MRFIHHLTHYKLSRCINERSMHPENGKLYLYKQLQVLGECLEPSWRVVYRQWQKWDVKIIKVVDVRQFSRTWSLVKHPHFQKSSSNPVHWHIPTIIYRNGDRVVMNAEGGHILRTKSVTTDEGGVAVGAASLDSPSLIPAKEFIKLISEGHQ